MPEPLIELNAVYDVEAQQLAAQATSVVLERAELATDLDPSVRTPLYALISSLADNKFVLGRQYVAWCTGAPILESAIASAAMAQDEMGHARSLYPVLRGFPEATDADTMENEGWLTRPTSAIACLDQSFGSWLDFVAANVVIDTALTVLFEAATESWYEPLGQRARKICQEEGAHWTHGQGWLQRLSADPAQRSALLTAIEQVWDHALTWYGQDTDPTIAPLHQSGLIASDSAGLRTSLLARLMPPLEAAGFAGKLLARPLPWERWDPRARRLGP